MKPLSISTEFSFSIDRKYIEIVTSTFKGGMFEDINVSYGTLTGGSTARNCHVAYTLKSTIQGVFLSNITAAYINKAEQRHKDKFFSRISNIKEFIRSMNGDVKIKTTVSFIDEIYISLGKQKAK